MSFANYKKINPTTGQREINFGSLDIDLENVEVETLKVLNNLTVENELSAPEIDNIKLELQEIKNDITSIKEDLAVILNALSINKNTKSIETNYSLTVKGNFIHG